VVPRWASHQTSAKFGRILRGSAKASKWWSSNSLVLAPDHKELGLSA